MTGFTHILCIHVLLNLHNYIIVYTLNLLQGRQTYMAWWPHTSRGGVDKDWGGQGPRVHEDIISNMQCPTPQQLQKQRHFLHI